jgi:hypothetical protein
MFKRAFFCVSALLMFVFPSVGPAQQSVPCWYYLEETVHRCQGEPCYSVGQLYWETKCRFGGSYACSNDSGSGSCCNSLYNTDTLYDPTRYGQRCNSDMPPPDTKLENPGKKLLEDPQFARLLVYDRCRGTYESVEMVKLSPQSKVYWRP